MKFKNILICALAAFSLASCADEGPDVVTNVEISATTTTVTSTTVALRLTVPGTNSNDLFNIPYEIMAAYLKDESSSEGMMYRTSVYYSPSQNPENYADVLFSGLKPSTKYTLYVEIRDVYSSDELPLDGATIQVPGYTVTTTTTGDYAGLGIAELTVDYAMFEQAVVEITLPDGVFTESDESVIQVSTEANFLTYNTIIPYQSSEFGRVEYDVNDITGKARFIVYLYELTEGCHYYIRVAGKFYFKNGYNTEYIDGLDIINGGTDGFTFPTMQQLPKVGTVELIVSQTNIDYTTIDFVFPKGMEYWDRYYSGHIVISTDPDFNTITDIRECESYYSTVIGGLTPATTYYVRLYSSFTIENQYGESEIVSGYVETDPKSFTTLE